MNIVCLLILAVASAATHAKTLACPELLAGDRARLAAGLKRALATDERLTNDPVIARLDQDILTWAAGELSRLTVGRRERALRILEGASLGSPFKTEFLKAHEWLENAHGHIFVEGPKVHLVIDAFDTGSEASRFTLRHELGHLFRFVEAGPARRTAGRARRLVGRPLGPLLEEAYVARDDYRYLRRVYAAADVPRLAKRLVGLDDMVDKAVTRGFVTRVDEGEGIEVDIAYVQNDADQTLLYQILTAEADLRMIARIEMALRSSESEWIRNVLVKYRDDLSRLSDVAEGELR